MATKIFRNSSNQPIYLNLPGGRSLKVPARGQAEVDEADAGSSAVALHVSRGNAVIVEPEEEEKKPAAGSQQGAAQGQRAGARPEAGAQPTGRANDEEGGTH